MRVIRTQIIEILINDGANTKLNLPQNPQLERAFIVGIQSFDNSNMGASPLSEKALIDNNDLRNTYLTLVSTVGNVEIISNMPLLSLKNVETQNYAPIEFAPMELAITKCFVKRVAGAFTTANTVLPLLVSYYYQDDIL